MAAYTKITAGIEPMMEAINAGTAAWKVALSNASPTALTTFTPGTDDLGTAGGYTAGGNTASITTAAQTSGTYKLVLADPATWTASGANIGPFRYVILWDDTANVPVGFWDYGSSITLLSANSDTFTADLSAANGVFTVA